VAAAADCLADDLRYVHASGLIEDKREFLQKISSGQRRYLSVTPHARRAFVEGGFGFVCGESETIVQRMNDQLCMRIVHTAVYRLGERPRLMVWQATTAVPAK
jgi:hypothetical protein